MFFVPLSSCQNIFLSVLFRLEREFGALCYARPFILLEPGRLSFALFFFPSRGFFFSSSPIYRSSRLVIECSFTIFFCTETRPSFSFSFLLVSIYLLWQPRACFKIVCMLSDTNFKPRKALGN